MSSEKNPLQRPECSGKRPQKHHLEKNIYISCVLYDYTALGLTQNRDLGHVFACILELLSSFIPDYINAQVITAAQAKIGISMHCLKTNLKCNIADRITEMEDNYLISKY